MITQNKVQSSRGCFHLEWLLWEAKAHYTSGGEPPGTNCDRTSECVRHGNQH